MDGEVHQKAVPSQECLSSWLHPSSVQRIINSLRAKAQTTFKTRDVRVKPYRNQNERNNLQDKAPNYDSVAIDKGQEWQDDELKELKYRGRWLLLFDRKRKGENGLTQQDRAWFKIEELVEKGLLSYAMASTAVGEPHPCAENNGCIWCFTEDCRDEHDVRVRAEVIRKALLVELDDKEILYVEDTAAQLLYIFPTLSEASIYRQTSDCKFWKKVNDGKWHHLERTKEQPVLIKSTEFRPAVPSRVKTVLWIGPSVVEREKYNVQQKATCISVKDTVEYQLGETFVVNTALSTEIKNKNIAPGKVIVSNESRLRDDTSGESGRKETKPTVMKCKETSSYTPSREGKPSDSKNYVNYSEIHLNSTRSIQDGLDCSTADETRPDDNQEDFRGTNYCKPDRRLTNKEDDEELISLAQYLEREDSYTKSVQDDDSYVGIWTKFFNNISNFNLGLKSDKKVYVEKEKEKEEADGGDKETNERHLLGEERKKTDDGKEDVRSEKRENVNQETREKEKKETEGNGSDEDDGKQQREENCTGMWILLFDKIERDTSMLTALDRAWLKIDDLCEKGFLQYAEVSTAAFNRYPCSTRVGCILCYTEDYRNEEDVGWRADIIRQTLEEELEESVIYYSRTKENLINIQYYGLEDDSKYVQTPDYCLWEWADDDEWILVPRVKGIRRTRVNFVDRELVPSKLSFREWIFLYYPPEDSETEEDSGALESTPVYIIRDSPKIEPPAPAKPNNDSLKPESYFGSISPSCSASSDGLIVGASGLTSAGDGEVKLSCLVYAVGEDVKPNGSASEEVGVRPNRTGPDEAQIEDSSESEDYGGKWMLHLDRTLRDRNGLTLLDRVWFKLEDLCLEKRLIEVSVSTAKGGELAHTPGVGCICCFTEDYRNIGDVRRKGYLIRKTLEQELGNTAIYYKTNAATLAAQYSVFGCQRVCIYKQKSDGSLWERIDEYPYWKNIF